MAVDQLTVTDEQLLDKLGSARERLLREIRKAIIGQDEVANRSCSRCLSADTRLSPAYRD